MIKSKKPMTNFQRMTNKARKSRQKRKSPSVKPFMLRRNQGRRSKNGLITLRKVVKKITNLR